MPNMMQTETVFILNKRHAKDIFLYFSVALYAAVAVEDLFAVYYVIELRVGSVSSANELGTCIECLVLRQRRRIVGLERVLRATHL